MAGGRFPGGSTADQLKQREGTTTLAPVLHRQAIPPSRPHSQDAGDGYAHCEEKQALAPIHPLLTSLGAGETTDEGKFTFQTDEGPFLVHGVPSFVLWTEMTKYELLHHKPSDTFDKVNQRDLNLGVAVVGMTAYAFADAPAALNQLTNAQMEEQLKKIKALAQYQDMVAHNLF